MTQQPQEGFEASVEDAREWMKAVQERLQISDNTQGPRAALEARLRETEVGRGQAGIPAAQPQVPGGCPGAEGSGVCVCVAGGSSVLLRLRCSVPGDWV